METVFCPVKSRVVEAMIFTGNNTPPITQITLMEVNFVNSRTRPIISALG
jgi:hypothetical protein